MVESTEQPSRAINSNIVLEAEMIPDPVELSNASLRGLGRLARRAGWEVIDFGGSVVLVAVFRISEALHEVLPHKSTEQNHERMYRG